MKNTLASPEPEAEQRVRPGQWVPSGPGPFFPGRGGGMGVGEGYVEHMSAPGSDALHSGRTSILSEEHERECLRTIGGLGHLSTQGSYREMRRGPLSARKMVLERPDSGRQGSCSEENTTELALGEGLQSIVVTQGALGLWARLQRC